MPVLALGVLQALTHAGLRVPDDVAIVGYDDIDFAAAAAVPLVGQGLALVAHPVIRNRGTTVGSIAHADPSGEMPSVLVLTAGVVEATSVRGTREIPAAEFFLGPLESCLAEDEVATAIEEGGGAWYVPEAQTYVVPVPEEHREALAAFFDKRPAVFTGS